VPVEAQGPETPVAVRTGEIGADASVSVDQVALPLGAMGHASPVTAQLAPEALTDSRDLLESPAAEPASAPSADGGDPFDSTTFAPLAVAAAALQGSGVGEEVAGVGSPSDASEVLAANAAPPACEPTADSTVAFQASVPVKISEQAPVAIHTDEIPATAIVGGDPFDLTFTPTSAAAAVALDRGVVGEDVASAGFVDEVAETPAMTVTQLVSESPADSVGALEADQTAPPASWRCYFTAEGQQYYHNHVTGVTQWEHPGEPIADEAPAA